MRGGVPEIFQLYSSFVKESGHETNGTDASIDTLCGTHRRFAHLRSAPVSAKPRHIIKLFGVSCVFVNGRAAISYTFAFGRGLTNTLQPLSGWHSTRRSESGDIKGPGRD